MYFSYLPVAIEKVGGREIMPLPLNLIFDAGVFGGAW